MREYGGGYISKKDAKTDSSKGRKKTKRPKKKMIKSIILSNTTQKLII